MMIEKLQADHIKSFEPKEEAIKDLYNHTHELMKRLAWSSRKSTHIADYCQHEVNTNSRRLPLVVQEW